MSSIMQGTTPTLTIYIPPDYLVLTDVTAIDLYVKNNKCLTQYAISDLVVDTNENTVSRQFTAEETAAFDPKYGIIVQALFTLTDGNVIGMEQIKYPVTDMIGVGV